MSILMGCTLGIVIGKGFAIMWRGGRKPLPALVGAIMMVGAAALLWTLNGGRW